MAASLAAESTAASKPNFGCQVTSLFHQLVITWRFSQVTVQSEEEKALLKQARKEEKKINKLLNKADEEEEEEELDFNPVDLRTKRQAALAMAMNAPLFKEREEVRANSGPAEEYPHVYDSLAKAKLTSGFVQGTKMALPAGFTRKDDKKYEEVTVPAMEKGSSPETREKRKPISELDEITQLAFKGMKSSLISLSNLSCCILLLS